MRTCTSKYSPTMQKAGSQCFVQSPTVHASLVLCISTVKPHFLLQYQALSDTSDKNTDTEMSQTYIDKSMDSHCENAWNPL